MPVVADRFVNKVVNMFLKRQMLHEFLPSNFVENALQKSLFDEFHKKFSNFFELEKF